MSAQPLPAAPAAAPELPDGLYENNGRLMATCRCCRRDYELCCIPSEYTYEMSYCGRSERCLP